MVRVNEAAEGNFSKLSALGFSVFPLPRGSKRPIIKWSQYQSTLPTEEDIRLWDSGDYNIGIVCGAISDLLVVDVDSAEGQDFIDALDLPDTPTVQTAKGRHYYFRNPDNHVGNKVRLSGVPVDIRANGGFVVGPESRHETGHIYNWEVSPEHVSFANLPESFLALLTASKSTALVSTSSTGILLTQPTDDPIAEYIEKQHCIGIEHLDNAKSGCRNDTLFRVSVALANHVAAAGLDWERFGQDLLSTATSIGLDESEAIATIDSAWRTGSDNPSSWIRLSRDWIYIARDDIFWSVKARKHLPQKGFNGLYNSLNPFGKGSISNVLLNNDLVKKVFDTAYDPTRPAGSFSANDEQWFNLFRPSELDAVEGDAQPFQDFVCYLIPNDEERTHLLKMIAWTVRNPGLKLGHALLMRSQAQGVGKSMLIEIWRRLLGSHNTRKTTTEEINSAYQGYVADTLLVVVEELNMAFGVQGYNRVKDLITGDTAVVNEKFIATKERPNLASFVFLTNLENPVLIEDTDRRFFFIDSPALPRDETYYIEFSAWWKANLGVVRHFLDQVDLSSFNPRATPPDTSAKQALRKVSRTPLAQELAEALLERRWPFTRDIIAIREIQDSLGPEWFRTTSAQIQKALRDNGAISLDQHRVPGHWHSAGGRPTFVADPAAKSSLWAVANVEFWPMTSIQDRVSEYQRSHGIFLSFDNTDLTIKHASCNKTIFNELRLTA